MIQTNNDDDHYCYVDVTLLELDKTIQCWKPYGAIGDKVTLQSASILKRDRYDDGKVLNLQTIKIWLSYNF